MTNQYSFEEKLAISKGRVSATSTETIKQMIPGCVTVVEATEIDDRTGIDFVATLRRGAELFIDLKSRDQGCSRFWNGEPELALESYSVMKTKGNSPKVGWTLNEASKTHYTLHVFDKSDCEDCWLLPFQLLRIAFYNNYYDWMRRYPVKEQDSGGWNSQCVFVPVGTVIDEIKKAMIF